MNKERFRTDQWRSNHRIVACLAVGRCSCNTGVSKRENLCSGRNAVLTDGPLSGIIGGSEPAPRLAVVTSSYTR
jgi:hypothetical protein